MGKLALAVNAAAFVLTGDLPWVLFSILLGSMRPTMPWLTDSMLTAMVVFPAPMALLAMSVFYLWAYARRGSKVAREPPRLPGRRNDQSAADGLYLMLLGSLAFLLLGTVLAYTSGIEMVDFRVLYYPARCLLHHGDPYNADLLLRSTVAETGDRPEDVAKAREVMRFIYVPTVFCLTLPIAALPWGAAHILWIALIVAGLIFASLLIWDIGGEYAPLACGALIGCLLLNSELLVVAANSAGIAIDSLHRCCLVLFPRTL